MTTYYLRIPDLASAHGDDERFGWRGQSPQDLAQAIGQALSDSAFVARWRSAQPEPETLDEALLATDAGARVTAEDKSRLAQIVVTTKLPHRVLSHRLNLLIGAHWKLEDVK